MWRCQMGYCIEPDGTPPDRCHNEEKWDIIIYNKTCKEGCSCYNHEYDLIEQAIESAKCRIYRLKQHNATTLTYQKKAKNQQKLMEVTIKALEHYRDES